MDDALRACGERLRTAAVEGRAFGLAAAHIGEALPVIVLNLAPDAAQPDYAVWYNPEVLAVAAETEPGSEASVSLPGVEAEIVRPVWAECAWDDSAGTRQRGRFEGFVARCALHELEQMNGRFYLANLSRLKREMVLKKVQKRRS